MAEEVPDEISLSTVLTSGFRAVAVDFERTTRTCVAEPATD